MRTTRLLLPTPFRSATAAAVLLLAAGCQSQQSTSSGETAVRRGALSSGLILQPNSVPYRVSRAPHATGRSGSAELYARALLGRDGRAELSLRTAPFGSEARGEIDHVQLKLRDSRDRVRGVLNYRDAGRGGAVSLWVDGLGRGQPYSVQANVRGIDGARTDVVEASGQVWRRPDLAVRSLQLPERVPVRTPVALSAVISEVNGDVGARADCILSVDGVEVDRSVGIWVDAGDTVSCAFTHQFDAVGQCVVEVALASVDPADDDSSNDAASATMEVVDPVVFRYTAQVRAEEGNFDSRSDGWYERRSGTRVWGSDWSNVSHRTTWSGYAGVTGEITTALPFPLKVTVEESSDGAAVASSAFEVLAPDWTASSTSGDVVYDQSCAWRYDGASAANLYLCVQQGGGEGRTTVMTTRYAGEVTYFTSAHNFLWSRDEMTGAGTSSGWVRNSAGQSSHGGGSWPVGATYGFDVTVTSDRGAHRASPAITTTVSEASGDRPYRCTETYSATYNARNCSGDSWWRKTIGGVASGEAR